MIIFSLHTEARFQAQLKAALTAQRIPLATQKHLMKNNILMMLKMDLLHQQVWG